ncbi:MAG TPA: MFS transporter [Propionibacteriaceae bacterium]|nr:MFS transporter [Propionibacteriaceae bacterium]
MTTGLILTPATAGILAASAAAQRLASRRTQRTLIIAGFVLASLGMAFLLVLVRPHNDILLTVPGTLAFGLGVGVMLTASVNLVQSAFPAHDQGEISVLSRSVSNLGSTFGTAMAGSVLVAAGIHLTDGRDFGAALLVLLVFTLLGLAAAVFLPRERAATGATALTHIE